LSALISLTTTAQTTANERVALEHGSHGGKRTDAAMQQWREYGLGQFIHWGVYAIPGGQWNGKTSTGAAEWFRSSGLIAREEYDNLYKQFNPTDFDAKKWAKQAKQMGARYLIFTTKHHDGFCMWPSKYTNYTIANTPYKKDIVKDLVDAYTAEGIDVYLYFSIIDWNHPGYQAGKSITADDRKNWENYNPFRTNDDITRYETFKTFTRNQLIELLTNYPKAKGLWFDGSWDGAWMKQAAWVDELGKELRAMHPGLIIGSRFRADDFGSRHIDTNGDLIDDYDQRFERSLPADLNEVGGNDWDCVMTIPENQWGYHRDWSLSYVKTPYDLIEMAVKANSLDGNFVINFGPDGKGNIRQEETDVAKGIGEWLAINGAAIYGTHHSILEKQDWGYSTQKDSTIYLTVFNKPMNNLLRVKLPKSKDRNMNFVISMAKFLFSNEPAPINGGGKAGTYYRDKNGSSYYDLIIPEEIQKINQPFVIVIQLKEMDKKDQKAYQQAII
jgi:alpha-L-fucosidase